jgi:hypothetical protein
MLVKRTPIKRTSWLRSTPKHVREKKEVFPMAFPKPSAINKTPEAVKVFPDGREKINHNCKEGRDLYQQRRREAWEKQDHICALCKRPIFWKDCTTDHIAPRGMGSGKIDDRASNIQAVHIECNIKKGSRRDVDIDEFVP